MHSKDAIKSTLESTRHMVDWYLADLSDEDLQKPPVPKANNIAWQLAHLIESEPKMLTEAKADYPDIPAAMKVDRDGKPGPAGWQKKADYLELFGRVRGATIAAVEKMSDADFDKPTTGEMAKFAPTLGHLLIMAGIHTMMHVGQFTVVRRALDKPVLF